MTGEKLSVCCGAVVSVRGCATHHWHTCTLCGLLCETYIDQGTGCVYPGSLPLHPGLHDQVGSPDIQLTTGGPLTDGDTLY